MPHEQTPKATEDIEIRNYRLSSDFQDVAELLYNEGMFNPERDRYEHLKKLDPHVPMKVAVAMGKRIVGSLYINGGIGVVEGVVVHPDFRRRGVGRRLVQAAMDQLRKDGHRSMELQIDEDRDDLKAWYESLGFKRTYHVVGMMQPLEPPLSYEPSEISVDTLDRATVSQAFMNVYMRYRPRSHFEYHEPILSRSEIKDTLRKESLAEVRKRFPNLDMRKFMDDLEYGVYNQPAIPGDKIHPAIDWKNVDDILKESAILPLRTACFNSWAWAVSVPSAWLTLQSDDSDPQTELVQCWLGRHTEYPQKLERRPDTHKAKNAMDIFYSMPNDTFLFLRQAKGIQRFGHPPYIDWTRPDGDFLCHDQANNNTFAFRIDGDTTKLLGPEETAMMLEELVRYAKSYEQLTEDYRPK